MPDLRIGKGYDIHRLVAGRPLILGGVKIPHNKGLLGHSDADALLHAITDALLGALALGDIGQWFPDTSPQHKDADSMNLLQSVLTSKYLEKWQLNNLDCNIIAQEPKLAAYVPEMRKKIAAAFGCRLDQISVKARTNEKLDALGRGEAIATECVVLLSRKTI